MFVLPSPIQALHDSLFTQKEIEVWVKRDDLIHPIVSGNKWRKLHLNIQAFQNSNKKAIVTFGGSFSNHIAATAFACKHFNIPVIGIIRGEKPEQLSPTLQEAETNGMRLIFVSRENYKNKNLDFLDNLNDYYLIPEGGANELGVKGCEEIMIELSDFSFDFVCLPCGTATTISGIVHQLKDKQKAIGFPALKGDFMKNELQSLYFKTYKEQPKKSNFEMINSYHFGGYAKINQGLKNFAASFFQQQQMELDLVYTAKMFYGFYDLVKNNFFPKGSKIVLIHTGGLQGNRGFH